MDIRAETRYRITGSPALRSGLPEIRCELDLTETVNCQARDISLGGVGFEIERFDGVTVKETGAGEKVILRVLFGRESVMAGCRIAWSSMVDIGGRNVLRGGARFEVITPEDRLKLYDLVGRIREQGAS